MNMYPYDNAGKERILESLADLILQISPMILNKPGKTSVELELSGLMHDIRFHSELVTIFHPIDEYYKKCITDYYLNEKAAHIFVSRADRNIRKSFVTLTLFSLETILKLIATHHKISISKENTICKYKSVMKYFDIYSEENENLVKILHYTRNTLHNGDRVDKEAHISYQGKIFDFVPKEKQKGKYVLESTTWNYLPYFFQQLLEIFRKIIISQKFTLK